jgi:two-component system heavy metal sensor histidine kinase CusS
MLDRLEAAVLELRRFTADASHELRTPLSVLKLQAQSALSSGALDAQAAALVRSQLEEIEALKLMVEDLLTLSRLESEPAPLARGPRRRGRRGRAVSADGGVEGSTSR